MAVTVTSIPVSGYSNIDVSHSFGATNNPCVLSLHSYRGTNSSYDSYASTLAACEAEGWSFVSPNFVRGGDGGTGSDRAVAEVLAALAWAKTQETFDKVFIMGGSGGGYMSLLMAGRYASEFDAVASIVPFTSLLSWYDYNTLRIDGRSDGGTDYRPWIDADLSAVKTDSSWKTRSPIFDAANVTMPVYIQHGQKDNVVPPHDSLHYFNALCAARGEKPSMVSGDFEADLWIQTHYSQSLTPGTSTGVSLVQDSEAGVTYLTRYKGLSDSAFLTITDLAHTGQVPPVFTFFKAVRAGTIAYDPSAGSGAVDPGGDIVDASLSVQDETALSLLKGEDGADGETGATGATGPAGADAPAGVLQPSYHTIFVDPAQPDETGDGLTEETAKKTIHGTRGLWKFQGVENRIKVVGDLPAITDVTTSGNELVILRIESVAAGTGAALNRTIDIGSGGATNGGFVFDGGARLEFRNFRPNLNSTGGGAFITAQGGGVSVEFTQSSNISMEAGNTANLVKRTNPARLDLFISDVTRTGAESYIVDGYDATDNPNDSAFISADVTSL